MPRPRKCNCNKETCFTCRNRLNWERWKENKDKHEVSDDILDSKAKDWLLEHRD